MNARRASETSARSGRRGTAHWQAVAVDRESLHLSRYLERVAAMPLLRMVADQSLERLSLAPGQRVLEVGCGSGVFLPRLAEAVGPAGQVMGIDHAVTFVAQARARMADVGTVRIEQADAHHLPFDDAFFDAAHCERVLMHVECPGQALNEMRRVVKSGGWIVAAEPDWGNFGCDAPDPATLGLLVRARARQFAQPRMGLELYRRFGEAGLVERSVLPMTIGIVDYNELLAYGMDLPQIADELIDMGRLTRERARAALDACSSASANGRLFCSVTMFIATGQVPPKPSAGNRNRRKRSNV